MLNTQVRELRCRTRRRQFPGIVDVYRADTWPPRSERVVDGETESLDHALRVDLLAVTLDRLLARTNDGTRGSSRVPVFLIHLRPDPCEPHDHDHGWWRALQAASDVATSSGPRPVAVAPQTVYAVTRSGWLDINGRTPVLVPRN